MTYEEYCNLRDSYNLTDYAVAGLARISRSTLSQWKNGKTKPTQSTLERLDRFFRNYRSPDPDLYFEDGMLRQRSFGRIMSPSVTSYYIKLMDGTTISLSADEYNSLQKAVDAFTYAWIKSNVHQLDKQDLKN